MRTKSLCLMEKGFLIAEEAGLTSLSLKYMIGKNFGGTRMHGE